MHCKTPLYIPITQEFMLNPSESARIKSITAKAVTEYTNLRLKVLKYMGSNDNIEAHLSGQCGIYLPS